MSLSQLLVFFVTPKSQLDLALFVPGRGAIELNLLLLLIDQTSESLSLPRCTVAYFTRELQQGSFKIYTS